MKPAHEYIVGIVIEIKGRINLLELAFVEDANARAHRHRFDLIVRDVDEGRFQALVQATNEGTRLHPKLRIEVGKRLVHQKYRRFANDGAADRHTLTLPTGELTRTPIQQVTDTQFIRSFVDALVDDLLGRLAQLEPECHIVIYGHVRVERVTLEYHGDIAIFRRRHY